MPRPVAAALLVVAWLLGYAFLGIARALPAALRSWTPTLRVEMIHRGSADHG